MNADEFEELFKQPEAAEVKVGQPDMWTHIITEIPAKPPSANEKQVGGDHYKDMKVQPWDVIDSLPHAQAMGFYRGNALKYIMRAGEKGSAKEDYEKAIHYLEKLLEILN